MKFHHKSGVNFWLVGKLKASGINEADLVVIQNAHLGIARNPEDVQCMIQKENYNSIEVSIPTNYMVIRKVK